MAAYCASSDLARPAVDPNASGLGKFGSAAVVVVVVVATDSGRALVVAAAVAAAVVLVLVPVTLGAEVVVKSHGLMCAR